MDNVLIINKEESLLEICLNHPENGNRLTMDMIEILSDALRNMTPATKLVVLKAQGPDFCLGRDYGSAPEEKNAQRLAPRASDIRAGMTSPIIALYSALRGLPVPSLALVRGVAQGFGCAMAGACDLVLASDQSRFSLPEMGERRLPPTLAMSALWNRAAYRPLTYMVFSLSQIDAYAAQQAGIVSEVVSERDFERRACALIDTILEQPVDAIRAVTEYLRHAPTLSDGPRAAMGEHLFANVMSSR
ncbi:MAG: enoyl-CoA hydratase/isomerase family protein [Burkholderiaceae bacterium]